MKDIGDKSIDMILCDLPYGTTKNKWDSIINMNDLWNHYERIITDNGVIVLFSQQPFTAKLINSNPKLFRYEWIWQKRLATGFLNANRMPLKKHENILVFYKKLPIYNPQFTKGKPYEQKNRSTHLGTNYDTKTKRADTINPTGRRYPVDIIEFKHDKDKLHPTQKPVALLEYLINTYTNENMTVLDNCMGSGSTGVACVKTNRNFIGMELDDKHFEIAKNRIEKANEVVL